MNKQRRDDLGRLVAELEGVLGQLEELRKEERDEIEAAPETWDARVTSWEDVLSVIETAMDLVSEGVDTLEVLTGWTVPGGDPA